jgi:hypothetical protein
MLHYDRLLPNPIIRLRWKGLPGRNTLAYYKHLQITDVRSLLSLGTGSVNELFFGPCVLVRVPQLVRGFVNYGGKKFYNIVRWWELT